jgi:predicted membrane protein
VKRYLFRAALFFMLILPASPVWAVDSYRYTHVTIETPWMIFIFLLVIILLPFILSAILYWYFATKKTEDVGEND